MQQSNLDLTSRSGVPDTIAHLRNGYPRSAWRFHPNYRGLTTYWLNIHAHLRQEAGSVGTQLLAAQNDPVMLANAPYATTLKGFLGHLDMHHRIEDASLFPGFRRADPGAMAAIDVLEADHHFIAEALEGVGSSGRSLLATAAGKSDDRRKALDVHAADFFRLSKLLDRHLNDEEEIVVPAMLIHGERVLSG